ncbi:AAA family ATPase [Mycobacterium sp. CVI_P3]|uniref:AAA family ATPase n=1 Tax=Mycobacterium pinniadriaticum TaxID=2994102 RepID=A0ABT3S8I8_9MYCO|nr:LuxR family transcriptional regulator [Mycobacterium pinniadriaticum]MCX2929389.1 AAA family ATPase [Mycobacterium pinniadriaticum]MCX2935813.1 AAA family ATPase [Mycobacterium pinniadriaticum]
MPSTSDDSAAQLRGRAAECRTLQDVVDAVRSGDSQVLVLRGEAGVGKTALVGHLSQQAASFRILQVAGVQSDMELAFAALQQLCAPLMEHLVELPAPQRDALDVAFGRGVGEAPDRFLVGLAVLSLMAAAAQHQPLLCVIDDAQWLDQVSVQTLGFVARRLLAEPIAMVFAARDDGAEVLTGLPELTVRGLSDGDARELLESALLGGIDPSVRDRVVAETRGNPLALLEVPRTMSSTELAGGFWLSGSASSPGAIETGYVRLIQGLPEPTRRLLLVAAAEPVGDAALFLRAAAALGVPIDALAPAEAAGVIEFGPRMRFRHPLLRSAAYRAADLAERRVIHRALADSTDAQADPDRRAWHAANAATGPDDAVAAELAGSAARAEGRGGMAAAAAFLERAAILTADPDLRGARALAAAQAKRDAAAPAAARELLDLAERGPLSEVQRARVARLRAQMDFVRSRAGEAGAPAVRDTAQALLDAARRLENLDDHASRESYLEALAALMYAGRLGEPDALVGAAEAALASLGRETELSRAVDFLLKGIAERITQGVRAGTDSLRIGLHHMCALAATDDRNVLRWMVPAFPILQESAAHELWDETIVQQLATAAVRAARNAGALATLPKALVYQAGVHLVAGEFHTATALVEEANAITAATDHSAAVKYHALMLTAWQGDAIEAGRVIEVTKADGLRRGEGRVLGLTGYAAAVLYNGLGRYDDALAAARTVCEYEDLGFYSWCLYELVEAAARSGDRETAAEAIPKLAERAGASGTDWGLGALASAQAMLADDDAADALFTEAIERLGRTTIAVHHARAQLVYGEWLRRVLRRADARHHLTEAYETFVRIGAQAFAERARRELAATGERVRVQQPSSGGGLTAQEAQIARLAGEGLTNQEIGAQLFISTHTVEWHLRKVFAKLGITSRRQLRAMSWAG